MADHGTLSTAPTLARHRCPRTGARAGVQLKWNSWGILALHSLLEPRFPLTWLNISTNKRALVSVFFHLLTTFLMLLSGASVFFAALQTRAWWGFMFFIRFTFFMHSDPPALPALVSAFDIMLISLHLCKGFFFFFIVPYKICCFLHTNFGQISWPD